MLIISRKPNQDILIGDGEEQITLRVIEVRGESVRLGISAPKHVPVHRQEVYDLIHQQRGEPIVP